ncbi:MAG: L-alanine-DL-glutamate epimerase [Kiritimatiellaeota bacterium]|nr:L-alanine-DL-glutamate epimerase [Kiritimatiellota bacterium]
MSLRITAVDSNFEREPLVRPFGFKGGYMREIWQTVAGLESAVGHRTTGLCTQSVLWSDARVFAATSEAAGNSLMFAMTEFALRRALEVEFETPIDLLETLLPATHEYGCRITGCRDLRLTFALNALVGLDFAAWLLYARERGVSSFDDLLPAAYRPALSHRHAKLASIPLMAYGIPLDEIEHAVTDGYFFLKIKIGADPDKDGDPEKMLAWDMARVEAIHRAIGHVRIPHTRDGKVPYYFDANGRYDSKERLARFLDHTRKIGAFDQIAILEEPFPEDYRVPVDDLGVRIAADESAHSDHDAAERIELGYGAIALKPIAKTLSMTLKIAKTAYDAGVPMFCADLTVGPVLVDWNKNVAARLAPLPGMTVGVLETNGHQNYARWPEMCSHHPCAGAAWTCTRQGLFELDEDFYARSGGIFEESPHYAEMLFPGAR